MGQNLTRKNVWSTGNMTQNSRRNSTIFFLNCVREAENDFTLDVYDDTYSNMELSVPRDSDRPEFDQMVRRLRYKDVKTIGKSNDNPILDTHMYEVE